MKRTRHQYHAVRRCKKQNLEFQKQKIAENISDSNKFWREVKRLRLLVKLSQIVLTRQMVLKKFLMYFMKNTECYYSIIMLVF